jgi:hypothetical protein
VNVRLGPAVSTAVVVASFLAVAAPVSAKENGFASPHGRRIYGPNETFGSASSLRRRRLVAETVVGVAPEGHLGASLGVLDLGVRGLDLFVGGGLEFNPSRQFTSSVRYAFEVWRFRPYVSLGYAYRSLYAIGGFSHNVSGELGLGWDVRPTLRISLGLGVRRLIHFGLHDDSPLVQGYTDYALLDQERASLHRYTPIVALRFSRSF